MPGRWRASAEGPVRTPEPRGGWRAPPRPAPGASVQPGHCRSQVLAGAARRVGGLRDAGELRTWWELRLAAHLLELHPRRHLLREQRRLDAMEQPLEPADQLRLRD